MHPPVTRIHILYVFFLFLHLIYHYKMLKLLVHDDMGNNRFRNNVQCLKLSPHSFS